MPKQKSWLRSRGYKILLKMRWIGTDDVSVMKKTSSVDEVAIQPSQGFPQGLWLGGPHAEKEYHVESQDHGELVLMQPPSVPCTEKKKQHRTPCECQEVPLLLTLASAVRKLRHIWLWWTHHCLLWSTSLAPSAEDLARLQPDNETCQAEKEHSMYISASPPTPPPCTTTHTLTHSCSLSLLSCCLSVCHSH